MNELEEKARERARQVVKDVDTAFERREALRLGVDREKQIAEIIAAALLAWGNERLEEAVAIAESHAWDYSTYPSRVELAEGIAQTIRGLKK